MRSRRVADAYGQEQESSEGDHGPGLLHAGAVVGILLIQAGITMLAVSTWWRHVSLVLTSPSVGSVLWHLVTGALLVGVVGTEIRALVRGRKPPIVVVAAGTGAMVVVLLLEAFGPR
ncbi:hypothetical protein LEP48_13305 [Isoptericola sp. NEAU-Y5]|uniref:Integral membrane protein n=1 Tax=Isoptericola luteus TaxID=2879484 RepID=A0ABS7ZH07_9MICO|nr:hypothetical protein [Isoptericola sp. NEAU-Y5]MCA5894318.1 hypothetical protein [Isoptericola sp. NEAU-Y5]